MDEKQEGKQAEQAPRPRARHVQTNTHQVLLLRVLTSSDLDANFLIRLDSSATFSRLRLIEWLYDEKSMQ